MNVVKRKLRKLYDVYIKRDRKRITYYKYLDMGGETLRSSYPLEEDAVVIDVGGYLGDFSAEMAKKFDCRIDIFEPVARYALKIQERFSASCKVNIIQAGLGGTDREEFISVEGLGSSVFCRDRTNKEKIKIISIVDYFKDKNYTKIDLMKINTEGGEYELLDNLLGCHSLIKRINYLQIQFHDFVPDAEKMRDEIRERLSETHKLMWDFPFIWESWEIK